MSELDGVYRHLGATLTWNAQGLTLLRPGLRADRLAWRDVYGARQAPDQPGSIQILVRPRRAGGSPDVLDVAVNSGHDANRLVSTISWSAAAPSTDPVPGLEARRRGRR